MSEDINRIEELAALIQSEVPRLIGEATDAINESITVAMEEAQEADSEAPAKLRLCITATWNLDTNTVEVSMPVAVKRKFTRTVKLPDHNQEDLPFIVTKEDRDGDPIPTEDSKAARKLANYWASGVNVSVNAALKTGGINE